MLVLSILLIFPHVLSVPFNDLCSNATIIANGTASGSNDGATKQTTCIEEADIFFYYEATCTGTASVTLTSSFTEGDISVIPQGGSCEMIEAEAQCVNTPRMYFEVITGEGYYFAVGSSNWDRGEINVTVECFVGQTNFQCESALNFTDGQEVISSTRGATSSTYCASDAMVWFAYQPSCTGVALLLITGEDEDLVLFGPTDNCSTWPSNMCLFGLASWPLEFPVTQGQTFLIAAGDRFDRGRNVTLSAQCVPVPAGDVCENAINIAEDTVLVTNLGASTQSGFCVIADIFFYYQPSCSGVAIIDVAPTSTGVALVAELADRTCPGGQSNCRGGQTVGPQLQMDVMAGQGVYFIVGSGDNYRGNLNVSIKCYPQPVNDNCVGALDINDGVILANNVNTFRESAFCIYEADLFFRYESNCTGKAIATFSTPDNSGYLQAVKFGGSACDSLGNSGAAVCATSSRRPIIEWSATQGTSYMLAVGSSSTYRGDIILDMQCKLPPVNDACAGALNISEGDFQASNAGASKNSSCSSITADIFFRYHPTCDGTAVATFAAVDGSPYLKPVLYDPSVNCAALSLPSCFSSNIRAQIQFFVNTTQTYLLAIGPTDSYRGLINISIQCHPPPANDACTGALAVTDGTTPTSNEYTSQQTSCTPNDVYYVYVATCTGNVFINFLAEGFATITAARFSGGPCGGSEVDCDTSLEVAATQNDSIYFAVGARYYQGPINITVQCLNAPTNDQCSGALNITDGVYEFTNAAALRTESSCINEADIFFRYVATCNGTAVATFSTSSSDYLEAVVGSSCDGLGSTSCMAPMLTFAAYVGQVFYIAVGSSGLYRGPINTSIVCHTAPANDMCGGALTIFEGNNITVVADWATRQTDCIVGGDVFFRYTATCTGVASASFTSPNSFLSVTYLSGSNCGAEIGCRTAYTPVELQIPVISNQQYVIAAGYSYVYAGQNGNISVGIQCEQAPSNDICENPLEVTDSTHSFTNVAASKEVNCSPMQADVFLTYNATCTGVATAKFTSLAGNYLQAASFPDYACGSSPQCSASSATPLLEFPVVFGQQYRMAVGSSSTTRSIISATISCVPYVVNNKCEGALTLYNGGNVVTNLGAVQDVDCLRNADIFFRYTATCNGSASFTFSGVPTNLPFSDYFVAARYPGFTCSTLGDPVCFTLSYPQSTALRIDVQSSQQYYLALGTSGAYRGLINASVTCGQPTTTTKPTRRPTQRPTRRPTQRPTRRPTRAPTRKSTGGSPSSSVSDSGRASSPTSAHSKDGVIGGVIASFLIWCLVLVVCLHRRSAMRRAQARRNPPYDGSVSGPSVSPPVSELAAVSYASSIPQAPIITPVAPPTSLYPPYANSFQTVPPPTMTAVSPPIMSHNFDYGYNPVVASPIVSRNVNYEQYASQPQASPISAPSPYTPPPNFPPPSYEASPYEAPHPYEATHDYNISQPSYDSPPEPDVPKYDFPAYY